MPRWRKDGRELYYASRHSLTVVEVELGERPVTGSPHRLLFIGETVHSIGQGFSKGFESSADGTRFLITRPVATENEQPEDTRAVHVGNWFKEFAGGR